jgi:hypothetical protein
MTLRRRRCAVAFPFHLPSLRTGASQASEKCRLKKRAVYFSGPVHLLRLDSVVIITLTTRQVNNHEYYLLTGR